MGQKLKGIFLLGIPTLFLIALFIVPLSAMVVLSFWRTENYHIVFDWTLQNYATLATESAYITFLIRSLVMATIVSAVCIIIAWPVAYSIRPAYSPLWQPGG